MSEKERESLAGLGDQVDAARFAIRIDYADGRKSYAPETLQDIASQGVGLVEITDEAFVPAVNIVKPVT